MMACGYLFYTRRDGLPVAGNPVWLTFTVFSRDFFIITVIYLLYARVQLTPPPSWAGKTSAVVQAVTLGNTIARMRSAGAFSRS